MHFSLLRLPGCTGLVGCSHKGRHAPPTVCSAASRRHGPAATAASQRTAAAATVPQPGDGASLEQNPKGTMIVLKRGLEFDRAAGFALEHVLQLALASAPVPDDNGDSDISDGLAKLSPYCSGTGDKWLLTECGDWQIGRHPDGWQGPARVLLQLIPAAAGPAGERANHYCLHELDPTGRPTGRAFNSGNQLQQLTDRAGWANWRASLDVLARPGGGCSSRIGFVFFQRRLLLGKTLRGRPAAWLMPPGSSARPSGGGGSGRARVVPAELTLRAAMKLVQQILADEQQPQPATATAAVPAASLHDAVLALQRQHRDGDMWVPVACGSWATHPQGAWHGLPARAVMQLWQVVEGLVDYHLHELDPTGCPTGNVLTGNQLMLLTDRRGWKKWKDAVLCLLGPWPSDAMRMVTFMAKALPEAKLRRKVARAPRCWQQGSGCGSDGSQGEGQSSGGRRRRQQLRRRQPKDSE